MTQEKQEEKKCGIRSKCWLKVCVFYFVVINYCKALMNLIYY